MLQDLHPNIIEIPDDNNHQRVFRVKLTLDIQLVHRLDLNTEDFRLEYLNSVFQVRQSVLYTLKMQEYDVDNHVFYVISRQNLNDANNVIQYSFLVFQ